MQSKKSNPLQSYLLITALLLAIFVMALSACSDNDAASGPDTRSLFVGEYAVEDSSSHTGYIYHYDVSIVAGSGNQIEISNFADIFNVPVKANVNGSNLTIPSQTFTNSGSGNAITVFGSGTLVDDVLSFTYETTGYFEYEGTCVAEKQ